MVGPAAKREAVAHLQAVIGVSERRACSFIGADRKMSAIGPGVRRRRSCAQGCATSPASAAASAIDACSFCSSERASHQGSIASTGSTARRA